MSIPTVDVTVVVHGQDGNPIEGANVTAKLDREDRYNGLVVRKTLRGKTDVNGELVLALFPNALGANASQYVVSIQTKEGTQRYTAYVPNEDCYLMSIVDLEPAPALSVAQIAIRDANAARAAAEGYADDAKVSAQGAAASESTAATSATTATTKASEAATSATTASTAATTATTKASEAATSATNAAASEALALSYKNSIVPGVTAEIPKPIFHWNCAESLVLHPKATFSRGSSGSYFDSSGILRYANNSVPRFDHDPLTGICKGLLVEPAVTFLDTYSEQFDNAAWVNSGCSVTANSTISPDGTVTADLVVVDTSTGVHQLYIAKTLSGSTQYSMSVYLKYYNTRYARIYTANSANWSTVVSTFVDLLSGTIISGSGTIDAVGNGWYRVTIASTTVASPPGPAGVGVSLSHDGSTISYTGDGTSGLYIWGAKLYAGTGPTSYLPTTTAGVARAADVCSVDLTKLTRNGSPLWNGTEGTVVVRFSARGGGTNRLYTLSDDTGSYTIQGRVLGTYFDINVSNDGTVSLDGYNYSYAGYTDACLLVSYNRSSGDVSYCSNGGSVYSSSGVTIPLVTQLYIGSNKTGNYYLNGLVKSVQLYNRRIADAYLPALSAL